MLIYKKSLLRKLVLLFFVLSLMIFAVIYFFYRFPQQTINLYVFSCILGIFLILMTYFVWSQFISPIHDVIEEMQNLLSGSRYKKIYTDKMDEIGVLAFFYNQVISGLGKASSEIVEKRRMFDELSVAAELQRDILPLETPKLKGLQIVAKNRAATEVGGDSFNIITIRDKTYIYIGDVTGHGVAAGLIMTMVNSLVTVFSDKFDSALDIMINVNKYIKTHVKKAMYMTMVMLCYDHKTEKLTYVGAGHEHILVYRNVTGECDSILSGGIALGMVPDNSKIVKEKEILLNDGDFVLLYTDGITEARNPAGELFGLNRLILSFKEYATQYSADGINYHIANDVSSFMSTHRQDDDMTLIVLKKDKNFNPDSKVDISTHW